MICSFIPRPGVILGLGKYGQYGIGQPHSIAVLPVSLLPLCLKLRNDRHMYRRIDGTYGEYDIDYDDGLPEMEIPFDQAHFELRPAWWITKP